MSEKQHTRTGVSLQTLLIAAAASAVAALVIPLVWRPGTVFAAAMTPVIVAIVSELLHRPVETVSSVAARRPARGADVLDEPFDEPFDPLAPPSAQELDTLPQSTGGRRGVHRRRALTGRQWKLALATGLVAFAAVAAVFTASELLAGESVTGGGRTTFFSSGSDRQRNRDEPAKQDEQRDKQQQEEEEPSPSPTATPETTATPEPTTSPEPAPGAVPTVTPTATPVPAEPQPTP